MATAIIMPRQGQSVESCIIGQWHKKVGDTVDAVILAAAGVIRLKVETNRFIGMSRRALGIP